MGPRTGATVLSLPAMPAVGQLPTPCFDWAEEIRRGRVSQELMDNVVTTGESTVYVTEIPQEQHFSALTPRIELKYVR